MKTQLAKLDISDELLSSLPQWPDRSKIVDYEYEISRVEDKVYLTIKAERYFSKYPPNKLGGFKA